MIQQLVIPGRLPALNELIATLNGRGGRYVYNKLKNENQCVIGVLIKRAGLRPMESAHFEFYWYEQTKRRDPDNIAAGGRKIILDSLIKSGILKNDTWREVGAGWEDTFRVDKDNPRIEVIMIGELL